MDKLKVVIASQNAIDNKNIPPNVPIHHLFSSKAFAIKEWLL